MSKYAEIAKKNYIDGNWSIEMLRNLVDKGRITSEEFNEITDQTVSSK